MKNSKKKTSAQKKFPVWGWVLLAVGLVVIVGAVALQNHNAAAASLPSEISVAQAAQKRDQGVFILDVREPSEWTQVHIPGATLIPLGQLPNRLNEVPNDREVVVVCHSGNRSATGRDILLKANFSKVTSMAGGMTQWQTQGLPTAAGQ